MFSRFVKRVTSQCDFTCTWAFCPIASQTDLQHYITMAFLTAAIKKPAANDFRPEPRIETRVVRDGVITMLGAGESYRPSRPQSRPPSRDRAPGPPRADVYRARESRGRSPVTDSYHPGSRDRSPRRRTSPYRRSPARDYRARSPPTRARSPPRRYSPRRDDDRRDRARSPRNDRYGVPFGKTFQPR